MEARRIFGCGCDSFFKGSNELQGAPVGQLQLVVRPLKKFNFSYFLWLLLQIRFLWNIFLRQASVQYCQMSEVMRLVSPLVPVGTAVTTGPVVMGQYVRAELGYTLILALGSLTFGYVMGYTSPAVPQMQKEFNCTR
jgi:hypothetical protein